MKLKTTNKQIRENFRTIISIGYCELQSLLAYKKPFAYNAGIYGWNCDFYEINNICISTGYRPIGLTPDYKIVIAYEKKAEQIKQDHNWKEQEALLDSLINQFTIDIIKGGLKK